MTNHHYNLFSATLRFACGGARIAGFVVVLAMLFAHSPGARAQLLLDESPAKTLGADIVERRGQFVPQNLTFTDAAGRSVTLGDYIDGEMPVILVLGYYDCPLLCTLVFNGVQDAVNGIPFDLGDDFRIVTVSFDHTNTTDMARAKQDAFLAGYKDEIPDEKNGWVFLTADASNARALAESVGYAYAYLPESGEFAHAACITLLTDKGKVSSYLYGTTFPPQQLRLALVDAADGKIGGFFDSVFLHYCYIYDPNANSYVISAMAMMRIAGALTVLAIGSSLTFLFWSSSRVRRRAAHTHSPTSTLTTPASGLSS